MFTDEYIILDSQKVPANKMEMIERRLIKVNRNLRKKFGTAEALEKHLREKVDADKNGSLSVDEFKKFLIDECREDLMNRKLQKADLEGFLSAFVYNTYGGTDIKSVAPIVFEKDANKLTTKLNNHRRANPPPVYTNEELGQVQGTVLNQGDADEAQARRLRNLLRDIEDKAFEGKFRMYEVFKNFDKDNDGFISYKDFESHLLKKKVTASKDEIVSLMKNVLDKDGDGYIDFKTF